MSGDLDAVLTDLFGTFDDHGAARHKRFGTAGAAAGQQLVGITLQQVDLLERNAQPRRQHLREG
jgi:hypothetical protein